MKWPCPIRCALPALATLCVLFAGLRPAVAALRSDFPAGAESWPRLTREQRPWAYWWWMGSAVDKTNLTRELLRYREAGYGGVHIIPIYGAKGWETNYLRYLSPRWMEMLDHTVREAQRLDLGVDMTTGTGWCFGGGPYVGEREGNANVAVKVFELAAGARLAEKLDPKRTQTLMAFPEVGAPVDLTKRITADGTVDWTVPAGVWKIYAVSQRPNAQKVKRAAPGGEGPMLNLIYPDAMPVFLRSHTEAFKSYKGVRPRAQYHDSYEYKSDWSPDFFRQFEKRRGYKLQAELPALFGSGSRTTNREPRDPDRTARVLADYRETVSDIMIEDSLPQWVKWSHQRGFLTRNEAHGSPGNLLDLYALADIPETEMFRLDRNKLISKFASSAAHVAGRRLTSAETGTWLKEHFTETLADMKYLVDDLLVSGVNHIFYHGTCYSPDEAGWPGWVFYASYEMNPRNSIWRDVRKLNDYVARCQSVLQAGQPDNDVLLYWPIHDFWQKAPAEPLLPHLTIHARGWFESQPIGPLAELLWTNGYSFDYVSDRQIAAAKVSGNQIRMPGGNYRIVVVPQCDFMPVATLEKLIDLARSGATVVFAGGLPKDVPGLGRLEQRRARLSTLLAEMPNGKIGKGHLIVGDIETGLSTPGFLSHESLQRHGELYFIRRSSGNESVYFIVNRDTRVIDRWVELATSAQSVVLMDPMTGRAGLGAVRPYHHKVEVYLQLQPGESIIVRTSNSPQPLARWAYYRAAEVRAPVNGEWRVEFMSGGPTLPATFTMENVGPWTKPGGATENFAGTARYSMTFDAPPGQPAYLDLGQVSQSARVKLNGRDYGTLLVRPFRVLVDQLKPTGNLLEVEVTSTSANAIRYYDREGVPWKNFHDINFVNQDYRPFNAADWPVTEAGLLGPVTVTAALPFDPLEAR